VHETTRGADREKRAEGDAERSGRHRHDEEPTSALTNVTASAAPGRWSSRARQPSMEACTRGERTRVDRLENQ
jgi:hypothetical protein